VASYLDMQTRIADELDRPDLTVQIKRAIVSAVRFHERTTFYFTETSFTFATVNGQELYTASDAPAIATSPSLDRLNANYYGTRTPLTKRTWDYLDGISTMAISLGQPADWAYRAEAIRLYPVPNGAYTITAYSVPRLTELSSDSDSNAWTNDAEALIRARAKWDLALNVIRGSEMADEASAFKVQEQDEQTALLKETRRRKATGMIQPTQF
jgi:hypothetical protein